MRFLFPNICQQLPENTVLTNRGGCQNCSQGPLVSPPEKQLGAVGSNRQRWTTKALSNSPKRRCAIAARTATSAGTRGTLGSEPIRYLDPTHTWKEKNLWRAREFLRLPFVSSLLRCCVERLSSPRNPQALQAPEPTAPPAVPPAVCLETQHLETQQEPCLACPAAAVCRAAPAWAADPAW